MTGTLDLTIADIAFVIDLPDPAWLPPLAQRYALFAGQGERPWRVTLVQDAGLDPQTAYLRNQGLRTEFQIFHHAGWIDLAAGTAQVSAPSLDRAHSALERVLSYICMQALPQAGRGLLLHGAGIEIQGRGHVFFGHSGAGKSTVARLAAGVGTVLTDENVILRFTPTGPQVISTPFWGLSTRLEEVRFVQAQAPLVALYQLVQGPHFLVQPLSPAEASVALLLTEKAPTDRRESAQAWLATVQQLIRQVPVYRLTFRPTPELWAHLP